MLFHPSPSPNPAKPVPSETLSKKPHVTQRIHTVSSALDKNMAAEQPIDSLKKRG